MPHHDTYDGDSEIGEPPVGSASGASSSTPEHTMVDQGLEAIEAQLSAIEAEWNILEQEAQTDYVPPAAQLAKSASNVRGKISQQISWHFSTPEFARIGQTEDRARMIQRVESLEQKVETLGQNAGLLEMAAGQMEAGLVAFSDRSARSDKDRLSNAEAAFVAAMHALKEIPLGFRQGEVANRIQIVENSLQTIRKHSGNLNLNLSSAALVEEVAAEVRGFFGIKPE